MAGWRSWPRGGRPGGRSGWGGAAGLGVCVLAAWDVVCGGGARSGGLGACGCVAEGACPAERPDIGKNKSTASKNGADPEKESPRR